MLKTLLKAVGLLACLAWFNLVTAATMGGINVMSALGHPLKAEISLGDLGRNDKSALVAKLATVNEFKGVGIEYPYSLPKLSFNIETRSNGEIYIKLTSTQPVNEPIVSLLIELSWPSGKLLREYTFLLDPAGFTPEQPKAADVRPVEPMVPVQESEPVAAVPVPEVAPPVAAVPEMSNMAKAELAATAEQNKEPAPEISDMARAELAASEKAKAEPVLAEPGNVEPAQPVNVEPLAEAPETVIASASILVEKGDTLGKIADEVKPVNVSLERMLVAMYRVNAKSFDGKNMNRIRAGKILRMPDADDIEKVTQASAVKEIRAQVADWQDYRQKLAAAKNVIPEQASNQEAAGKINAAVAEKSPVVKESAKEVLRLSKGEMLGDKTVAGSGTKSKQELLTAKADDIAAKNKQMQEEQKKIAELESISKEASKLVELKVQQAAPSVDSAQKALAASAVSGLAATKPAPAVKPKAVPAPPVTVEKGLLEEVIDDPVLLGAGAAVLLGLGGLGFVMVRKKKGKGVQKKTIKKGNDVGELTGSWRTPVQPSPDTGDFTNTAFATAAVSSAALDDVDPISEADLFLNFGRDAQAEEILKDALTNTPSNIQIKLKLLSIYVNRKDSRSFSKYAQEIKDSGDVQAWERAAVMGRELDPSNPTYGEAKGEARQREPAKAEVDFDLGGGRPGSAENSTAAPEFKMDFDLFGGQSDESSTVSKTEDDFSKTALVSAVKSSADVDATSILSRELVKSAESASPMDFDISGVLPEDNQDATKSGSMDFDISGMLPGESKASEMDSAMDFDVTGSMPSEFKESESLSTMDFDITGGQYTSTAVLQEPVIDVSSTAEPMNFNDLVFEIPTSEHKPAEETPAPKFSADEEMEFSIDFPTDDETEPASAKPASSSRVDIDFGDININLDDDLLPAQAMGDGKDEQWHEVATKLDLAKAYQEMGDVDGAREILEEVVRDGDESQRESAEKLMLQLAS